MDNTMEDSKPASIESVIEHPPHIHRLLRLIREGTSSHASRASVLLGRYAAQCISGSVPSTSAEAEATSGDEKDENSSSISPSLLIWDLIGRLVGGDEATNKNDNRRSKKYYQCGLFDPNWSTRCNCAMALESVAKCLPMDDRRHFFEGDVWDDGEDSSCDDNSNYLWLSVNDLQRVYHDPDETSSTSVTADTASKKMANQEVSNNQNKKSSRTQLDLVVERGRLLLSSSGEKYNWNCSDEANEYIRENESLQNLDATAGDNLTLSSGGSAEERKNQLQQSFLQRRVALQRQILSKRLGLGGILSAPIMNGNDNERAHSSSMPPTKRRRIIDDIIADEDLVVQEVVSSSVVSSKRKSNRLTKDNCSAKNSKYPTDIRALLVLESKKSEHCSNGRDKGKHNKHRNPQTLLGSELAFRTFDSEWTVRHGALLGTLSLLRAWRVHKASAATKQQRLGKWPQDILARCVCILALDQFSDFSGSDLTASDNKRDSDVTDEVVSNAVVAPVREMAAQIIAILLEVCPVEVWTCTHQLLMRLYNKKYHQNTQERGGQWEISHGTLLAWKYVIAITIFQSNAKQSKESTRFGEVPLSIPRPLSSRLHQDVNKEQKCEGYQKVFDDIISLALQAISDGNDDNRAVSAQILRYCLQAQSRLYSIDIVSRCSCPLWTAVTNVDVISACAADLLSLLAQILSKDSEGYLTSLRRAHSSFAVDSVLIKLANFIFHDSVHVSISALRALSLIIQPIVKNTGLNSHYIVAAIGELLRRIFETYFTKAWMHDDSDEICRVRDLAWENIVDAIPILVTRHSVEDLTLSSTFFLPITMEYFRVTISAARSKTVEKDLFYSHEKSSRSLARLYECLCSLSHMKENWQARIELVIEAMLQSPWSDQCEAACLLHVALSSTTICSGTSNVPSLLTGYMTSLPISVLLEECPKACLLLGDTNCKSFCSNLLSAAWDEMMQQKGRSSQEILSSISHGWEAFFARNEVSFQELHNSPKAALNQTSMRLSASTAGALVSCGRKYLPSKLTPLIRSLFTSLKNEQSLSRKMITCRYIADLIMILSEDDSYSKPKKKLLENVCNLVCEEGRSTSLSSQGAMQTIEFLIEHVDSKNMRLQDFPPIWERLSLLQDMTRCRSAIPDESVADSFVMLIVVLRALSAQSTSFADILGFSLNSAVNASCFSSSTSIKTRATTSIISFCNINFIATMDLLVSLLLPIMLDLEDDVGRKGGCELLLSVLQGCGAVSAAQYVPQLLPASMSLMTDTNRECAKLAASIFAIMVRTAPLAASHISSLDDEMESTSNRVIKHLILGKPMLPCILPDIVSSQLRESGTILRPYQIEGISWLKFLNDAKLNGALCDDMGLGKTLQALVAMAISHADGQAKNTKKSLVVCPASVVGHWVNEINRFFPGGALLQPVAYIGHSKVRRASWTDCLARYNVVVTSYSVLRTDVDLLESFLFDYCILDEGHLLKNPKTATAKASRRLKARHRLILTGTPVQGNVSEVWATFDFLMPNFLGSESTFSKEFAKPIIKSQAPDACANDIDKGLDCLKILHQQVLPFILRRDKMQVMNDLPPKTVTDVPCQLSKEQLILYQDIVKESRTKDALEIFHNQLLEKEGSPVNEPMQKLGSDVLKSLLRLRLVCTHPLLYNSLALAQDSSSRKSTPDHSFTRLDCSGKLLVLSDLLRHSGIVESEMAAADNDDTGFLLPNDDIDEDFDISGVPTERCDENNIQQTSSKCLIFAQFTQSLDIVEQYLFEPHMPSLQYLRLDGGIPANKRQSIVDTFNNDENIKVMLLTTKVGGLGLNLTGADKVIFLEPDWNPFVDIQAQDRAHRLGQTKAVNIYRLITSNTIEEKMMELQQRKKAISDAVVNSDNSTMYSMGTEKLLDIFTFRGSSSKDESADDDNLLSYLDEDANEYASLSVDAFLGGLS